MVGPHSLRSPTGISHNNCQQISLLNRFWKMGHTASRETFLCIFGECIRSQRHNRDRVMVLLLLPLSNRFRGGIAI